MIDRQSVRPGERGVHTILILGITAMIRYMEKFYSQPIPSQSPSGGGLGKMKGPDSRYEKDAIWNLSPATSSCSHKCFSQPHHLLETKGQITTQESRERGGGSYYGATDLMRNWMKELTWVGEGLGESPKVLDIAYRFQTCPKE